LGKEGRLKEGWIAGRGVLVRDSAAVRTWEGVSTKRGDGHSRAWLSRGKGGSRKQGARLGLNAKKKTYPLTPAQKWAEYQKDQREKKLRTKEMSSVKTKEGNAKGGRKRKSGA